MHPPEATSSKIVQNRLGWDHRLSQPDLAALKGRVDIMRNVGVIKIPRRLLQEKGCCVHGVVRVLQ